MSLTPAEIDLQIKQIRERLPKLYDLLDPCRLCPRECLSSRTEGDLGECEIGDTLVVSSIGLHHGNERPISGDQGSGNIFLSGCNLKCIYCQNWEISRGKEGRRMTTAEVAQKMLMLQELSAHNINWVSPTHVVPMLVEALLQAREKGLSLPLVYNTGGYDSLETLSLLDGIVDIYLPDMKYGDAEAGLKLSGVRNYPQHNQAAVLEMQRQVGPLQLTERGVAVRGLLVRHLVLPAEMGGSDKVFDFLEQNLPPPVYVNVMAQYRPCYRAVGHPVMGRRPLASEFEHALEMAARRPSFVLVN
jgi:putative pyruvate formate lyase activating enzyme